MKYQRSMGVLAIACALSMQQAHAADALIEQAQKFMQAGDAKATYALLEPQESTRAGDVNFDLLFALAALEIGQNTRAIFALERILAQDPKNARARAEIGRAYLATGETESARNELQAVKNLGVPGDVEKSIDNLLVAVERLENEGKTKVAGYVEATFGYDTNVNAGPDKSAIAIPSFGGLALTLNNTSRATGDWFGSVGAGVNVRSPLNKQLAIVAGASGSQRLHQDRSDVDLLTADANLGLVYKEDKNVYSLSGQASSAHVENSRFREALGFTAQWQNNIDARNQVSAFVQYSDLTYTHQPARDANRWVWGGAYAHALRNGMLGYVSVYMLEESVHRDTTSRSLNLDGYGLRLGGQMRLGTDTTLFTNLGYEIRNHKAIDTTFLVEREDKQFNFGAGISHALNRTLKLVGQYSRTDQRSNTAFNQYERDTVSLTLRQEF